MLCLPRVRRGRLTDGSREHGRGLRKTSRVDRRGTDDRATGRGSFMRHNQRL